MGRTEWLASRPRILAAASSLVHDRNYRILLLHASWKDEWQLPGGTHDEGEDLWQTAVRETSEETGLAMPAKPRLLAVDWTLNPEGVAEVWGLFQGPLVDGGPSVRLSDEHDEWKMLTIEEWTPLLPPYQARVLATAVDMLRNGGCTYLREGEQVG
ncbi:NUDIX domain-containing protein [Streptomyces griseocarneus]|uniref:NUDIX domain-containing protein n=1 Tax=Streptomyces griseocarneus TaxID=51201 RepID=UPI00167C71CE|nr:NUDIX hydrolase [Streptomyces griseocarneus]MBZ6475388.1 NUDIX hydrolase [Streptomyces griseocarneus]